MKLLVDMNLSPQWVQLLRDAGWVAAHWATVGKANAPDSEITAYAATNNYVILTHDLDFGAILAATHQAVPSVVQIRTGDVSGRSCGQANDRRLTSYGIGTQSRGPRDHRIRPHALATSSSEAGRMTSPIPIVPSNASFMTKLRRYFLRELFD